MQQHRVVAGFGNGQMKLGIGCALFRPGDLAFPGVAVLQCGKGFGEPLPIHLGRTQRCVVGAAALERVAKLQ